MEWEAIRKHPNDYAGANLQSVPASISEPSEGMRNSAIASPSCLPDSRFGRCDDFCRLRDCSLLEVARIGNWHLFTTHAAKRSIEFPKRLFHDTRANLC